MNVYCKSSCVEWFKEGQPYTIHDKQITCKYGTEYEVVESCLTPGFFTAYSEFGRSVATFESY